MRSNYKDLTDMEFGRLKVLNRDYTRSNGTYWWCECNCKDKTIKSIDGHSLKQGLTKSCGCLNIELTIERNKILKRKYNTYDLTREYGVGYTNNNEEFYFDLEDYDLIKNYCWILQHGYVYAYVSGEEHHLISMHRLVMKAQDEDKVDHIFHNLNDNRKSKLRLTTHSQNLMNKSMGKNNTSGVIGVSWDSRNNDWVARITANSKNIHLGRYKNFQDAVCARKAGEEKYHGKYSYANSMNLE